MKLRTLAMAAAAVAATGSAQALTPAQVDAARTAGTLRPIYVSGASALRLSFAAYVQNLCTPASFDVFFNDAAGANHRAYACNLRAAVGSYPTGTPVLIIKRDQGGSGQGVNPVATATAIAHMVVSNAGCVRVAANPTPATDIQRPGWTCGTTANVVSDAGISDVEPALLQQPVNLPTGTTALTSAQLANLDVAPLVQGIFGVAVNKKLYLALQKAQGLVPTTATVIDETAARQPTLSETFVRSALTGQLNGGSGNATTRRGWNLVVPTTVNANVLTKTINICRRAEGSGTQAASNAYFAGAPCSSSSFAPIGVAGSTGGTSGTIGVSTSAVAVNEATGTGGVETCLGTTVETATGGDNIAYGLAVLGRENNPRANAGDKGYRYVRLASQTPDRAVAKAGNYPVVYEATMQWNRSVVPAGSAKALFLGSVRTGVGAPNSLAAADVDTQQGVMSPPGTYTGPYVSQTGNAALFGSRVSRLAGASCAPLRIVK